MGFRIPKQFHQNPELSGLDTPAKVEAHLVRGLVDTMEARKRKSPFKFGAHLVRDQYAENH